jgi:hypothetical protein
MKQNELIQDGSQIKREKYIGKGQNEEQCCGSGMFIPDPGSEISDPGHKSSIKREG